MAARTLALLIVMLVLIACGTDPGTSPTITGDANLTIEPTAAVEVEMPVETATPSTLPTPTPSPGPDPGRELIVSYLEAGLETPSDPTVFMDLLARIPDMDEMRDRLTLSDIAAMREIAGIATPARDAGLDALDTYIREVAQARKEGLPVVFPAWPAYMRDYLTSIVTFPYLGFDLRSIDQTVSAGNPPNRFDVALGRYDPEVTANALANCDCDQPEIREHNGVSYYAWGEGLRGGLSDRLKPPFYDHLGRGPRLLIEDGVTSYSIRDGNIPNLIDAALGVIPTLAGNEDYALAARWFASLGAMVDAEISSSGFSADEVRQIGVGNSSSRSSTTADSVSRAVDKGPLLLPLSLVVSGNGFDGVAGFTGLVLVHDDSGAAEENVGRLISRIREGTTGGRIYDGKYMDIP